MKAAVAGWLVFFTVICIFVSRHGTHWTWGALGMPQPIIQDGCYPDGVPADPFTRELVSAGYYQQVMWVFLGFVVSLLTALVGLIIRSDRRARRELKEIDRRERVMRGNCDG